MELQGLHHITMITGDAQSNVDFYADKLGLRLVKKTVNFDSPDAYHLYFGDEAGTPGTILTWFEFAGARPGRAGAGMIHTLQLGVASEEALAFWTKRLDGDFTDPDGLQLAFVVSDAEPHRAVHPEIPEEFAITGVVGARAYGQSGPHPLLTETLGFTAVGDDFELGGFTWGYDAPPAERGVLGAGTVHHIAWASKMDEHEAWRAKVLEAGLQATPVIDRFYFKSVYFREPGGILYELATLGPGFTTDEPLATLGERLALPPDFERLRDQVEPLLTPLPDVRQWRPA
jgi:glyoxalase family protein